ncbi:hypothetical protein BDF19DRAFT_417309 [Syncephalis fuscata]|nr:hypothetical protein BDF19DRAFT_417309 [Syncephalis fuscata]
MDTRRDNNINGTSNNEHSVRNSLEGTRIWFVELFTLFAQPIPTVNTAAYTIEANKVNVGVRAIFERILRVHIRLNKNLTRLYRANLDWNETTSELFCRSLQLVQKALQRVPLVVTYDEHPSTNTDVSMADSTSSTSNIKDLHNIRSALFYYWLTGQLLELLLEPLPPSVLDSVINTLVILDTAVTRSNIKDELFAIHLLSFTQELWIKLVHNNNNNNNTIATFILPWHQNILPGIKIESDLQGKRLLNGLYSLIGKCTKSNSLGWTKVCPLLIKCLEDDQILTQPYIVASILTTLQQLLMNGLIPPINHYPNLLWSLLSHTYCLCCCIDTDSEPIPMPLVENDNEIEEPSVIQMADLLADSLTRLLQLKDEFIASIDVVGRGWIEFTMISNFWDDNSYILLKMVLLDGLSLILEHRPCLVNTESWLLQGLACIPLQHQVIQCLLKLKTHGSLNGTTQTLIDINTTINTSTTIYDQISEQYLFYLRNVTNQQQQQQLMKFMRWPYDEQTQSLVEQELQLNNFNIFPSGKTLIIYAGVIKLLAGKQYSFVNTALIQVMTHTIERFMEISLIAVEENHPMNDGQSIYLGLVHLVVTVLDYYDTDNEEWLEMVEYLALLPWIQQGITSYELFTFLKNGFCEAIKRHTLWSIDAWSCIHFILTRLTRTRLNQLLETISKSSNMVNATEEERLVMANKLVILVVLHRDKAK